jgi:hypothetical protein
MLKMLEDWLVYKDWFLMLNRDFLKNAEADEKKNTSKAEAKH